MDVFWSLFSNLLPLYILIGIGWFAGRHFGVQRETLANLSLFVLMPVMLFGFVSTLDLQPSYALLPLVMYGIQWVIAGGTLWLGRKIYDDSTPNLMAMCTAMGNFGYFGLPLVLLLFPPEWIGVYMFMLLGNILFEATVGYYIAARGNFTVRQSIRKLLRFPSLYAVTLGLLVNFSGLPLPDVFFTYLDYFKGAYVICGMMIIGVALSYVREFVFGPRFLSIVFAGKFIAWPFLALTVVSFDRAVTNLFDPEVHKLFMVLSIVPPAANIAAFATQLNLTPEKAATTILAGTLFALIYIPGVLFFFPL